MSPLDDTAPSDLVMRDLVDALIQENICSAADRGKDQPPEALTAENLAAGESWYRIELGQGWVCFRVRSAMLQPYRLSRPPVWHGSGTTSDVRPLEPRELLGLLLADEPDSPGAPRVAAELRAAVEHAAVSRSARSQLPDLRPRPGDMLAGELLATTRGRPFHPTARAVSGWSSPDFRRYGPLRQDTVGLDWVAVRRDRLRWGNCPRSQRLHELLLGEADLERLDHAMLEAGLDPGEFQPLPAHPWQAEHVLPSEYAAELESGEVVPLARDIGNCRPTASVRTMAVASTQRFHVKLPLGVSTLGAARLLPPRYLDNGDRAQRTMRSIVASDESLARWVLVCDESAWCGWRHPSGADEFEDRPGHLAAQVRIYPENVLTDPDVVVVPMAALAAHEWQVLAELSVLDPAELFEELAEAFCEMALSFLRHGVLPELHGQNVQVVFRNGTVDRFILRDHDTLRLCPEWMAAAGVPDPGYRIKPGAAQSLKLAEPRELLCYLQTLGFQVNLFGIADALARHAGIAEAVFWRRLRTALGNVLQRLALRDDVVELVEREVLHSPTWPSRHVLGPLLASAAGGGVSMPAGRGLVPNPLREQ